MSSRKKKEGAAAAPRARSAHGPQRQRLIDACISALHIHGPSRTTVERVVAIAKMSPGIVRFYFESKAAMLVASLQFLSAEFEEQVLEPVSKLKANPVVALELLVDLYLDPEIASPRKVSVWYAFWGEASSRQEYYDICGQKDESFAALVRELIDELIEETAQPHLDTDGVALGLIGALEMLWQDFAFRSEEDIDRAAAKRRCMAYLESVFPGRFAPAPTGRERRVPPRGADVRLAGWAYGSAAAATLERESLFRGWQIAAHESLLARAGDFLALELGAERVLLVRDGFGALHALRNSCPELPHALLEAGRGQLEKYIECRSHGLAFELDGRRVSGSADLVRLDSCVVEGLVAVGAGEVPNDWLEGRPLAGLAAADAVEIDVAANWKLIVEQWLESAVLEPHSIGAAAGIAWSPRAEPAAQRARRGAAEAPRLRFVLPNQLLEWRPEGASILQAIPTAPARCRIRRIDLAHPGSAAALGANGAVGRSWDSATARAVAESAQRGVLEFGYRSAAQAAPAIAWFRRHVATAVPELALERPPNAR